MHRGHGPPGGRGRGAACGPLIFPDHAGRHGPAAPTTNVRRSSHSSRTSS